jgi:hypothetical protein
MASSSTGLLPVTRAFEVLLGADVHAGLALERVAGGFDVRGVWGQPSLG